MRINFILLVAVLCLPLASRAERFYRLDAGSFNGRIARTQSGNVIPLNAPVGIYAGGEFQYGSKNWRGILNGTYYNYRAKVATASETYSADMNYGDIKLGGAYVTQWTEWRLLYVKHNTPYTHAPDPSTLVPGTMQVDYLRLEGILNAKASNFRLAFQYFLNYAISEPEILGGTFNQNYFIGGCVRSTFGEKVKIGPAVCVELQEFYLPSWVTVFRQEVHARVQMEF